MQEQGRGVYITFSNVGHTKLGTVRVRVRMSQCMRY